jgi:hypothetical protein
LIDKSTSNPYGGPDPVIVVSIDGGSIDGVANFAPLLASSSLLGRFFGQKDGSEVAMDTVLDAVKLLNDLTYRKKAEDTKTRLASLPEDSPDRGKLRMPLRPLTRTLARTVLSWRVPELGSNPPPTGRA